MNGMLFWPNGLGYTPCSLAYELKKDALEDARECGDETAALHLEYELQMMRESGHMGALVEHAYDAMTAIDGQIANRMPLTATARSAGL